MPAALYPSCYKQLTEEILICHERRYMYIFITYPKPSAERLASKDVTPVRHESTAMATYIITLNPRRHDCAAAYSHALGPSRF